MLQNTIQVFSKAQVGFTFDAIQKKANYDTEIVARNEIQILRFIADQSPFVIKSEVIYILDNIQLFSSLKVMNSVKENPCFILKTVYKYINFILEDLMLDHYDIVDLYSLLSETSKIKFTELLQEMYALEG